MNKEIMERMVDAGAEALRQRLQGGKRLVEWASLPPSRKSKWIDYACIVMQAAYEAGLDMIKHDTTLH